MFLHKPELMKKIIVLLLFITVGCQTASIKNKKYKTSLATTELGSIGKSTSMYNTNNNFTTHSFPVLQNKIRLDVQILPLNKKINKIYTDKASLNPAAPKITYVDSLAVKPEYVTLNISDLTGFATELNAEYNKTALTYLEDTNEAVMVTAIAMVLPVEDIAKIKQADAFYLLNNQEKKYTLVLYKAGKKTDNIEFQQGTVLAYALGKFCWAVNDRQQWYIGDIVEDTKGCRGKTRKKIKDKETNVFKL